MSRLYLESKIAVEGSQAYKAGKGISDNPYVAGYDRPFEKANEWQIGYLLCLSFEAQIKDWELWHLEHLANAALFFAKTRPDSCAKIIEAMTLIVKGK